MNQVKCFTTFAVMATVSGLVPFQVANGAVQTANQSADNFAAVPASVGVAQTSGSGITKEPVSRPLTGFLDALQSKSYGITPPEFFDQPPPGFKAITLADEVTSKANGLESSRAGPDSASKSLWHYRATPRLRYVSSAQPLLFLRQPAIHSFVSANGRLNFKLLNPLIQSGPKDQALQIKNMSTRPWTVVVGWHPGEFTLTDIHAYEPHFDLFWIGAAPER